MAKAKETEDKVEEEAKELIGAGVGVGPVAALSGDFGREDLNLMRDKINELIARQ